MKTKSLKTIIGLLAFLLINTTVLMAQPQGDHKGPPKIPDSKQINKMISELSDELTLSDKQSKEIKDLYTKHFEEVKAKLESEKSRRDVNKKEMDDLKSSFETSVKSILTADQQKKFDKFQKEHKPRNENHPPKR